MIGAGLRTFMGASTGGGGESLNYTSATVIDTEYLAGYGTYNNVCQLDSNLFAFQYNDNYQRGYVGTATTDTDFNNIAKNSVSNWSSPAYGNIVKIDTTHFIIAAQGGNGDGFLATFSIDESYNITKIHQIEHDPTEGGYHSLIKIDDTHFMLAYKGYADVGYIKTFSIDDSYNITQLDSLNHETSTAIYNSLIMIDSTHFALAYGGYSSNGYIKTFSIDGSYNITQLDSLNHDTSLGRENALVKLDDTHFILAYMGLDSKNYIKTFSIDGSYNITEIDNLLHGDDTTYYKYASMVGLSNTQTALIFTNSSGGMFKIFSVDADFNISIDFSQQFTTQGRFFSLQFIDNTHLILAFTNSSLNFGLSTILLS